MKGRELRTIRQRLGLTQAKVAAALAVAPNTVARWERDERRITPPMALLIRIVAGGKR